jgi:hypothetical protein
MRKYPTLTVVLICSAFFGPMYLGPILVEQTQTPQDRAVLHDSIESVVGIHHHHILDAPHGH